MSAILQTVSRILLIISFALVIGAVASFTAIFFVDAVHYLNRALLIAPDARASLGAYPLMVATVAIPTVGGLVIGQLRRWIADSRLHGPQDVIEAAQVSGATIRPRDGVLSGLGSLLALGAGASTGQYGPLTHLGAAIGTVLAQLGVRMRQDIHLSGPIGIGCGVAAAIATAFNAPIAGVVFAHEVVLRHYSLRAFAPITVSATVGYVISNSVFGRKPLFDVAVSSGADPADYVGFVLIGVAGAMVSLCLMRGVLDMTARAERMRVPDSLKPGLAGIGVGVIALAVPEVMGMGIETMQVALGQGTTDGTVSFALSALMVILLAKIVATIICVGLGFGAGIFGPALFIGTFFGALVGGVATQAFGTLAAEPAFYAICGLAAVTSPVVGAPLTTILIVFELTRNYELTTAVMVSVVFANLVCGRFLGRSIFDVQLLRRGFDLSQGREKILLQRHYVGEYVQLDYCRIFSDMSLAEARAHLLSQGASEAYLQDAEGTYLGVLRVADMLALDGESGRMSEPASQHSYMREPLFYRDTSIWDALEGMQGFVGDTIPVCDTRENNRLVGVVSEADIVNAYLNLARGLRQEEHAID